MTQDPEKLRQTLISWFAESRKQILAAMAKPLDVARKSNRNDLVTNVDKANQKFLINHIKTDYPEAGIIGEEGHAHDDTDLSGLVFFVDPIDGTMNFVKQQAHFAIMIGVYRDGQPVVGAIMDVMRNEVLSGGPEMPVTFAGRTLTKLPDLQLKDGLLGVTGPMTIKNRLHLGDIALASSGPRMSGSAGMEFIEIALGRQLGYVSYLQPWDVAAGMAITKGLGVQFSREDGSPIDLRQPGVVVAATPQAHRTILAMMAGK
ncbi:inositol monophosphatase family protein [Lacticaseibacillus zeae]|uniref:Inositol monophosphatase family protein n=1 Tax=Lacticaseibacillus zeae subsp. silagei TaxID=3068307 RepID=A0ABD7ZD67_LACZE|nr:MULTISPECIES: inositol monophosphatase family protein [Lacticaseibacillus]MDE3315060.1 inositol monophosphatase family protein [Lacticaseibacillus zeae]OFR95292.1 fructose 1,6-bisphosphatase [Lactobacillus sp. HMSC068F07]WLV84840.1 inositol monophosphatase family protein [Lacticaseibacillus sp. NCIMB 15475]WLV85369.1 inositol monophosphatase family protein [Lacticaseibacillus sp. NCIMB 15474]